MKKCVAVLIRLLFRLCSLAPQKKTVAFLSRQSARPFDFVLLEPALQERLSDYNFVWACVSKGGQLGVGLFLRQLYLAATSALCLVDGYVPAVSIPRAHRSVCVQLWHASGAIKKFGYQCLDTPAGRSSADAQAFRMHKGYDFVIAGMQGALPAFAKGFGADPSIILSLGLPHLDYLLAPEYADVRTQDAENVYRQLDIAPCSTTKIVLYAPTFRRGKKAEEWLLAYVQGLAGAFAGQDVVLVVAGHPLEADAWQNMQPKRADQAKLETANHADAAQGVSEVAGFTSTDKGVPVVQLRGSTIKALHAADVVISDYSSVALDAGVLGKPVFFYVPDIEEYRQSPGLNLDPLALFPDVSFTSANALAQHVTGEQGNYYEGNRLANSFQEFMTSYAANVDGANIPALANFLTSKL